MDQLESSGSGFPTLRSVRDGKRKSKKRRKAKPDDGDDVCAICDDGGYVTCCDGGCMRSFHLTEEHGEGSVCPSLGINSEEAKMIIDKKAFICKNCKYKQHQCSACGLLGSSDLSAGAEVFRCKDYNCGHFYHPKCISKLLYPDDKLRACLFEQYVAAGLKFLCYVHKCSVCHGAEKRDDKNMQFAVCRLCPITYHRKCLPSDITFEAKEAPNGYIFQRAWDGILRDRILIYCMKHEIVKELGIPRRKLIVFPDAKNLCVPKVPESAPKEQDALAEEQMLDHPSSEPSQSLPSAAAQNPKEQGALAEEEMLDHPSSEPSQSLPSAAQNPKEQGAWAEEEMLDHPSSEPSQSLPSAAAHNQCFCSNPMDSFAPKSLFPHPYPGSCGWLSD